MKDISNIFDYSPQKQKTIHPFKFDKAIHTKDDVKELNRLLRITRNSKKKKHTTALSSSSFGRPPSSYSESLQRVTFKSTHNRNLQIHKNYLSTYIRQMNKAYVIDKPEVFGQADEQYYSNIVPLHFKCIISPENTEMDFETLTRCFVKRIEYLTGHGLYWKAAIHNDTGHRHIHLCINGKDTDGKNIFFEREMIKHTMREILQDIATKMIGPRTYREIELAKENQIKSIRWTDLDKKIEKMQNCLYTSTLPVPIKNRLVFLSQLNLATVKSDKCHLSPEWKEVLQASGRYNTFLDIYSSSKVPVHLYEGGILRGKVDRIVTFEKNEAWNNALVINQGNKLIYVPVYQLHKQDKLLGKDVEIEGCTSSLSRQITDKNIHILSRESISY